MGSGCIGGTRSAVDLVRHARTRAASPLAPLTTLRIGGPAARVVDVEREDELSRTRRARRGARARPSSSSAAGATSSSATTGSPGSSFADGLRGVAVRRDGDRVAVDVAAGEPWDALVGARGRRGLARRRVPQRHSRAGRRDADPERRRLRPGGRRRPSTRSAPSTATPARSSTLAARRLRLRLPRERLQAERPRGS